MPALAIRTDRSAEDLRQLARREKDSRVCRRLLAIANALAGMSRAPAARRAGMERQALRDAVVRDNAEGVEGLRDRPRGGRPPRLSDGQMAAFKALVLAGPDPDRDGVSRWRAVDLCRQVEERVGVSDSETGMLGVVNAE